MTLASNPAGRAVHSPIAETARYPQLPLQQERRPFVAGHSAVMARHRDRETQRRIEAVIRQGEGIVTSRAWRAAGLPTAELSRRAGPDGSWQLVHPGVYATHRGALSERQRLLAGFAYAGDGAVLTGRGALTDLSKFTTALPAQLVFLIPHGRTKKSLPTVEIERTRRLPAVAGPMPRASYARAIIDACRRETSADEIRHLIGLAIQRRKVTLSQLLDELDAAPPRGSGRVREALGGAAAGVRGAEEARVRAFLLARGLREPQWNVHLWTPEGEWVAYVDGFLDGLYFEVQSRKHHLYVNGKWESDLARMTRLGSYGGVPVLATRSYLRDHGDEFADCVSRGQEGEVGRNCRLVVGPPPPWWGDRAA